MSPACFRAASRTVLGRHHPRVEASLRFYYLGCIQTNKQTNKLRLWLRHQNWLKQPDLMCLPSRGWPASIPSNLHSSCPLSTLLPFDCLFVWSTDIWLNLTESTQFSRVHLSQVFMFNHHLHIQSPSYTPPQPEVCQLCHNVNSCTHWRVSESVPFPKIINLFLINKEISCWKTI